MQAPPKSESHTTLNGYGINIDNQLKIPVPGPIVT